MTSYHAELTALVTAAGPANPAGLARLASTAGPRGFAGSLPLDGGMRVFDPAVSAGLAAERETARQERARRPDQRQRASERDAGAWAKEMLLCTMGQAVMGRAG
nr:unnamed protein product [Digitaria exilis]